jgi:hypothetical protein
MVQPHFKYQVIKYQPKPKHCRCSLKTAILEQDVRDDAQHSICGCPLREGSRNCWVLDDQKLPEARRLRVNHECALGAQIS